MIRLLNVEPAAYSPAARAIVTQLGELTEEEVDRAQLIRILPAFDVLITRLGHSIDAEVLTVATRLRAIASATTGLDHIDLDRAAGRGITVISLHGEEQFLRSVPATAEHTWALLLALTRRVVAAADSVRRDGWRRDEFRGHDLAGRRLGIVGLGRIGRMVARYGATFGMKVSAFDPYVTEWPPGVDRAKDLEALFRTSDVVTLHAPLSATTRRLVGRQALAWLSRDAVLVNTSRGDLVDEAALVEALESGGLAGAALDVVSHEREHDLRQASPLISYMKSHDNLLITPHIGGATHESMQRCEEFVAAKLATFLSASGPGDASNTGPAPR